MGEVIKLNQPYWKSFRLPDGKTRWFYTDEETKISIKDKDWFNKNTTSICIHKGYETEEYSEKPVSEMIYRIAIDYKIANYFGDRSGMHFRSKVYMLIGDKLYKQDKEVVEVKRLTKRDFRRVKSKSIGVNNMEIKDYFPKRIRDSIEDIVIEPDFDYGKNRSVQHYFVYLKNGESFDGTTIKELKEKVKQINIE